MGEGGNGTRGEKDKRKREEIIHVYVRTNKDEHREIFNKYYIHFLTTLPTLLAYTHVQPQTNSKI